MHNEMKHVYDDKEHIENEEQKLDKLTKISKLPSR